MSKTKKSSWKAPFGLTIFIWATVLITLLTTFALLSVSKVGVWWGKADLCITSYGVTRYDFTPFILSVLASFLPLLTFPIGKRMRGHQRLLALSLFLVSAMIFIVGQGFQIYYSNKGITHTWYGFLNGSSLELYTTFEEEVTFNFISHLVVFLKYALCFLPLLAFPIANKIHKKNKGIKAVTISILLLILTCWVINLYAISFDVYGSYWFALTIFDADGINIGLFCFLAVGLASLLPLAMIGITGPRKEENHGKKHYEVAKIVYCPIEKHE